jgi:hypothetical protein
MEVSQSPCLVGERIDSMSKPCPSCGRDLDDDAAVCKYCGTNVARLSMSPPGQGQQGPIVQPGRAPDEFSSGPFSSPPGMLPVIGKTTRRVILAVIALLAVGGVVVVFFLVTHTVRRGLDAIDPVSKGTLIDTDPNGGGKGGGADNGAGGSDNGGSGSGEASGEFGGARAVFREMNADAVLCKRFNSVVDSSIVSAGTCFAGAEPWTIQVFFDDLSFDAVVSNYVSSDTIHVAYGGNWTVLTQSKASSQKIAKALGGKGK